ncbi:NAD(P)-binding domain-containing protein [Brachybacterium huguangmaarense]|uniref:NAD(P)-binding domain-containing protein n=1 Tax=Brachybacterium huguangmaarense TaxID=1652028 RepID=A0ABY6G5R4_9MICO|nr:NAD(P)-binding domain-containing protein [Brachybacterium huguangmaarense]UYG18028.1 NAD(P)-binding domain-containing protein [Brachybacterium huguangmaarense]
MSDHRDDSVPTREKVLVIGAGPAGLAAAAALRSVGLPFDLVDAGHDVGGIWNGEEGSPVWEGMHPLSSKELTQFEDLVMPASFPAFPSPEQLTKYLRAYAARHHLTEHFQPGTTVRRAVPFDDGVWQVELSTGQIGVYRAVIAATGTSSRPHLPGWARDREPTGDVRLVHARDWHGPEGLEGRSVLVVGSGQSAADIAVDAASRALEVRWSVRTGHWIVPRTIAGTPGDVAASREPAVLGALNEKVAETVVRRVAGDPAAVGLPRPAAGLLEDRVIVSDDVIGRIREGRIAPMPDVTSLDDDGTVAFADGRTWAPSVIVLATGYEDGVDALGEGVVPRTASGAPDLFLGAFPRGRDDLAVLGQVRVTGGIWPVLAQQADLAALFLRAAVDGDAAAEGFRRLRRGSDDAVPVRPASERSEGWRGRIAERLDQVQGAARRRALPPRVTEPGQLPFADREDLLARLRTVRSLFEDRADRA